MAVNYISIFTKITINCVTCSHTYLNRLIFLLKILWVSNHVPTIQLTSPSGKIIQCPPSSSEYDPRLSHCYSCSVTLASPWRKMEVGGQRHVPSTLPPGERPSTGWALEQTWTGAENLAAIGIRPPVHGNIKYGPLNKGKGPPIWRVAVNKLNKQPRTADEGWSSSLGVGRGVNTPSQ
jgi:hypothetical protein